MKNNINPNKNLIYERADVSDEEFENIYGTDTYYNENVFVDKNLVDKPEKNQTFKKKANNVGNHTNSSVSNVNNSTNIVDNSNATKKKSITKTQTTNNSSNNIKKTGLHHIPGDTNTNNKKAPINNRK